MNDLRSVSTGLVSIRYLCGLDGDLVSGRPVTRVTGRVSSPELEVRWKVSTARVPSET